MTATRETCTDGIKFTIRNSAGTGLTHATILEMARNDCENTALASHLDPVIEYTNVL